MQPPRRRLYCLHLIVVCHAVVLHPHRCYVRRVKVINLAVAVSRGRRPSLIEVVSHLVVRSTVRALRVVLVLALVSVPEIVTENER